MSTHRSAAEIWLVTLDALRLEQLAAVAARCGIVSPPAHAGAPPMGGEEARRPIAHAALRLLLAGRIGSARAGAPFAVGIHGKPHVAGGPAFSLSHSGGFGLIAIAPAGEVGIDIEAQRSPRMAEPRRAGIIRAGLAMAGGQPLPADLDGDGRLLQAWVRLEAVAKATGEGMGRLLTRLGILGGSRGLPPDAARGVPPPDGLARPHLHVRDLALGEGLFGAVAGGDDMRQATVRHFPTEAAAIAALAGLGAPAA